MLREQIFEARDCLTMLRSTAKDSGVRLTLFALFLSCAVGTYADDAVPSEEHLPSRDSDVISYDAHPANPPMYILEAIKSFKDSVKSLERAIETRRAMASCSSDASVVTGLKFCTILNGVMVSPGATQAKLYDFTLPTMFLQATMASQGQISSSASCNNAFASLYCPYFASPCVYGHEVLPCQQRCIDYFTECHWLTGVPASSACEMAGMSTSEDSDCFCGGLGGAQNYCNGTCSAQTACTAAVGASSSSILLPGQCLFGSSDAGSSVHVVSATDIQIPGASSS